MNLVNSSGRTGEELASELQKECDLAVINRWDRADRLHLATSSLESWLDLQASALQQDVNAGIRLWDAKEAVWHYGKEQMEALEEAVGQLINKNYSLAVRH